MGNKPPKQNTDWTEEDNQYIVKNYFSKGIRAVAKDLGRTQDAVYSHISKLRCAGYFNEMFNTLTKDEFITYVVEIQHFHYELLNNLKEREDETRRMIDLNLEMHHIIYSQLLNKLRIREEWDQQTRIEEGLDHKG